MLPPGLKMPVAVVLAVGDGKGSTGPFTCALKIMSAGELFDHVLGGQVGGLFSVGVPTHTIERDEDQIAFGSAHPRDGVFILGLIADPFIGDRGEPADPGDVHADSGRLSSSSLSRQDPLHGRLSQAGLDRYSTAKGIR